MYFALLAAFIAGCLVRACTPSLPVQARGFYVSALAGLLAGNTFTTKAVMEMLQCANNTHTCTDARRRMPA